MMGFAHEQRPELLAWAAQRLGINFDPGWCRWIAGGFDGETEPAFVVVYSRFTHRSCELTIATDGLRRWATRRSLRAIFGVPFGQWGMQRVTFVIRSDNTESLNLCRRLGASFEGRVRREYADDVDAIVMGMLKGECRWC